MSYQALYKQKLKSAKDAAALLDSKVKLVVGMAASAPRSILQAIEQRVIEKSVEEIKLYYMHSEAPMQETLLKFEHMPIVKPYPCFMGAIEREIVKKAQGSGVKCIFYMPTNFSYAPRIMQNIGMDVCILTVSPMDKGGFFSCGTNSDYTIPMARQAKKVIVEVNPTMPRAFGESTLHVSEVTAIVENDTPIPEIPTREPAELDVTISKFITEMIPDRATLQVGVGGVPNAVCAGLVNHKDLGIHSELLAPGLAKLIQSGAVTNKYKAIHRYKNVYTLAMGDRDMYDFIDNNASMEAYPVYHVNNPGIVGLNDNVISINSFVEIDLYGQVNAEFIGGHQFSAPGGQLDFVRGAIISPGGKSILTAYATAANGTVSRIVPKLSGPATDPRGDVNFVVTEYGVAELQGKSNNERAEALIQIAHPDFREELYRQAKGLNFFG